MPLGEFNVETIFEEEKIFNIEEWKKTDWVDSIKTNIRWDKKLFKSITPRV